MAIKKYNGVSYDDSVDYSAAIEQAKAAGQDTSQLEAARQAKIDDKYKGVEPVMYGSNQKYSDVKDNTSEEARQTVSNAVKTSSQINGYDYTNPSTVSTDKSDYSVLGKPSAFNGSILATIPRNADNANKKVKMGDYTITFNELGQAVHAKHDGGASATDYIATGHANDTVYHKLAYDAAARGEWDLASQYMNMMAETYQRTGPNDGYNTGIDYKAARLYAQELQNQFGYDDETYYNKRYDEAYGPNAAAVWDATNGAVRTYADLVNIVGAEKAQQMVESQIATNPSKYQTAGGGLTGGAPATQQFGSDAQTLEAALSANFGNGSGLGNGIVGGGGYDLSEVIRSQKEAELEAQLANLKGAFNKSEASLNDALAKLPQEFDAARNEVAAQYAIAQRAFDERAAASGLSSGASGQAALARSSVMQKGLAEIAQEQANAASEIELQKALLVAELEAAIAEALAQGEAELAQMLYAEMVRVQELEREDALLAAQREAEENELALKYAAELGLDASSLLGGGGAGIAGSSGGVQAQSSATNQTASKSPSKTPSSQTVDNGGLSENIVKMMQRHINQYLPADQQIEVDGKWGPATQAAAGGFTADEYAREYYRQNAWSGRSDR